MYTVGQAFTATRLLTQDDFDRFAALSGDDNPIHVDPAFAARTRFGKTVSHGMLLYGLACGALDAYFPDAAQLEQDLMFPNPARVGEQVIVQLKVIQVEEQERRARVETILSRTDGQIVCQGQTLLQWHPV
ncbi:MAG: MaoC family dehydratase [Chloroflexi bacterium]|nr:MaoC family dehydratase [Chloroflexota bacterium]